MAYPNPSASNLHILAMHALGDTVEEVGGFKVRTPMPRSDSLVLSDECLNEELRWWWLLKRKVFESAAPSIAFGTESVWKIVSQMRAHVLHAYSSCHPPPG